MDTSRRFGPNPFEIGLFSFNVDGGMAQTKVPFWDASWDNNVTVARLAEEAGLDFLLPLGRWHGTGDWRDETETEGGESTDTEGEPGSPMAASEDDMEAARNLRELSVSPPRDRAAGTPA